VKAKHIVLFIVTLAICAAIGFSFGAYPRFWGQMTGRDRSQTILILTSDRQDFPPEFMTVFFDETGYSLQIEEVKTPNLFLAEAKKANILYAPWEWLQSSKERLRPWPDRVWSRLFADFQSLDLFGQKFFPLFWSLQADPANPAKKQFHFEGLATEDENLEGAQVFIDFLKDHRDFLKTWTLQKKMASTLQSAEDWPDFPASFKPDAVRATPLANVLTMKK
jgi:hypothetical protein